MRPSNLQEDAELILAIVQRYRLYLGAVVSCAYELNEEGEAQEVAGQEGSFDRAFAACVANAGGVRESLAAICRLRADEAAWKDLKDRIAEIAGGKSKWPEIARLMAAPAGNA